MGQRRERLDGRLKKQAETRRKNAPRKAKERARREARRAAVAEIRNDSDQAEAPSKAEQTDKSEE